MKTMFKKYWVYLTGLLILGITAIILIITTPKENIPSNNSKAFYREAEYKCPYCHNYMELCKSGDRYYIECTNEECGYRTIKFKSPREANLWWNTVFDKEK